MRIPIAPASAEIEVKRSRFIAIAEPVESSEAVKALVSATRVKHPQANHVVHAAVIGKEASQFSFSDDREPRNTAGRPVFEVLKGSGITNLLIMVVRYFGGTLLGTGGLVKAYSEAAKEVLKVLKTEELIAKTNLTLTIDYDIFEQVQKFLSEKGSLYTSDFATRVTINLTIASKEVEALTSYVTNLSSGSASIVVHPNSQ